MKQQYRTALCSAITTHLDFLKDTCLDSVFPSDGMVQDVMAGRYERADEYSIIDNTRNRLQERFDMARYAVTTIFAYQALYDRIASETFTDMSDNERELLTQAVNNQIDILNDCLFDPFFFRNIKELFDNHSECEQTVQFEASRQAVDNNVSTLLALTELRLLLANKMSLN